MKGSGKIALSDKMVRLDILNTTREASKFMRGATDIHIRALYCLLDYCVATKERGLVLKLIGNWDGIDKDYNFLVNEVSDMEFCKDQKTYQSMGRHVVYLNMALVAIAC